ncbi:MAG: hypothetical protein QW420_02945 [Candidatus Caldarchaeum sp.]
MEAEIVFGIAALVYAVGLALFRLPLLQLRRWGWTAMMHSWSTVAVLSVVGSLALIKPLLSSYLHSLGYNLPLTATFEDAIASAQASRDMAMEWLKAVSLAAIALGRLMSVIMLALLPTWLSGVGVLLSSIVSFIFGAVFGMLLFITKVLSGVVLFMEGVVAFVSFAKYVAPALFTIGLILFAIPFARRTGKTFMVLGAALTLALPVAIVAASPPPGYADQSIMEAADVQKLSVASKAVGDMEGGARYTVYDRENDTLWYPFLVAEFTQIPEIDRDKACANLPRGGNLTCEQIIEIMRDVLKTPQKTIFDTGGGGYYNAYDEGYRMSLINGTYARRVWFLNMWVTLYDTSPRNITVHRVPEDPDPSAMACARASPDHDFFFGGWDDGSISCDPYLIWKERWESFWKAANLYNETSLWMVAANRNTTFVWFTEQPWGTKKEDLNIYGITLPKVRETRWQVNETYTCETDGNSSTTETCWRWHYFTRGDYSGNKSVYFVYLNMDDYDVCWHIDPIHGGPVNGTDVCERRLGTPSWSYQFVPFTSNPPTWNHTVRDSSFAEIQAAGFIDGYGPYTLPQSVEAIDRDQPLQLNAPTKEKKVFVTANQTIIRDSYDGYPEVPDSLSYRFRVIFTASDSMQYLPLVEWQKFDEDREYTRQLASGGYVPDTIMGISVVNHRSEWARYQNFRQGLYRDGPSHEATRRINAALLEYREENWETNSTVFDTNIPLAKTISETFYRNAYGAYAGSSIPISTLPILLAEAGSVAILKPLSELIGQAFAIGVAMALLALVIDSFQSLVGGQSVMMRFFFSKVGNISQAAKFFTMFARAVNRMSRVDMLARWVQRRQQNQLLKAALQERSQNKKAWEKMVTKKAQEQNRVSRRISGWMEKRLDRLEELENRSGFRAWAQRRALTVVTRSYALNMALDAVRGDKRFAEGVRDQLAARFIEKKNMSPEDALKKADALIAWAKQGGIVAMTPEKFAEGFATMYRGASFSEKVALLDSLARSDFGKHALAAYMLMPAGMAASWLGERLAARDGAAFHVGSALSWIGSKMDGRIGAPAAFSVAADAAQPFDPSGIRASVGFSTTTPVRTSLSHPYSSADAPVIKGPDLGGSYEDVIDAMRYTSRYGTPSDVKDFEGKVGDYLWITASPYEDFKLINESDKVYVHAGDGVHSATFEVSKQDLDDFMEVLEKMGYRDYSVSGRPPDVSVEDAQPSPNFSRSEAGEAGGDMGDFSEWFSGKWSNDAPPEWGNDGNTAESSHVNDVSSEPFSGKSGDPSAEWGGSGHSSEASAGEAPPEWGANPSPSNARHGDGK